MTTKGTTDYSDMCNWNRVAQNGFAMLRWNYTHSTDGRTKKEDVDVDSKFRSEFAIANSRRRPTCQNGGNSTAVLMQHNDPLSQLQHATTCCSVHVRAALCSLDTNNSVKKNLAISPQKIAEYVPVL